VDHENTYYEVATVSNDGQVMASEIVNILTNHILTGLFDKPSSIFAMAAQADGGLLIGGHFTSFLGQPRLCLARLVQALRLTGPSRLNDGSLQLQISGLLNQTVTVEATSSLSPPDWQPIGTSTILSSPRPFSDPDAARFPRRFYRAVVP